MEAVKTEIDGVYIIEPRIFKDSRGYFFESFSERDFFSKVGEIHFVQDNESRSSYGVLRGLHFQKPPYSQSKLVRVISGAVLDVVVDIRKGSPTFGRYVAVELSGDNHRQLFVPRGFAHGFSVLTDDVVFQYKCDNFYAPDSEGAIAWDDPDLAIDGEMQINFALNNKLRDAKYPFTRLRGLDVNTLVFPNLSSANSSYKLLQALNSDAEIIGPIQMGLNKPIHFTDFECSVRDVVNITAVAVIDAYVQKIKECVNK